MQTALPPGCLDIPEQVNITEHIVSRHVLLGRGDQVALRWAGRSLTFAELEALTDTVSASLRAAGAGRGDRIVLCSPNSLAYAASVLGAMKAGVVPVLTGPETTPAALQRIVDATGAVMVLTDHAQLDKLWSCDGVGAVGEPVREDTLADEPAYMHYTADGRPVVHAHRTVIGAGDPIRYGFLRLRPADRCLVAGDLTAMLGFDFGLLFPLASGARAVLHSGPATPERILASAEQERASILVAGPDFYRELVDTVGAEQRFDLSGIRLALCGPEPLADAAYHEIRSRFGLEIRSITGHPEAHVYAVDHPDVPVKPGSLGVPLAGRGVVVLTDD
ncbi:MAG: 4-hydroxybenzoate-CoA ligase, partial [Actinomycetota bacterium]|nr:4-hydroxybenzoate-CoA ligase [Actinomycetota bacterium]